MSQTVRNILLSLLVVSCSAVGCTLIAEVDRSKITDGDAGGAGGEVSSSGGSSATGGANAGGAGGEAAGGAGGAN